jgi:PAS domain S-box-containing protein
VKTTPGYSDLETKIIALEKELAGQKSMEAELQQRVREITFLNEIGKQVCNSLSLDQVVQSSLDGIFQLLKPDLTIIFLKEGDRLLAQGQKCSDAAFLNSVNNEHKVGQCLCGVAVTEAKAIYVLDINRDPRCTWNECKEAGFTSFAALPLYAKDNIIGVMGLASTTEKDFSRQSPFLEAVTSEIAIGLQKAIFYKKIKDYSNSLEKEVARREEAELALKESEKQYHRLTNNISETIWEIDIDTLQFSYVSPSSKSVSGFSDQEIKNSRLEELFPPSSLKLIADALSEELIADKSGFAKPRLLELEHFDRNGSTFWAEVSARFVRDSEGQPFAIVGVTRNISERKQIETALRESEEKYRSILENMEDGYFEVDTSGNFIFYNDAMCKILGYEHNSLKGMNNRQYMDKENAQNVFHAFNHVYRTGKSYKALDWELIRKDGTTCNVETSVSLLKNGNGQPIGFKGIARDITERKQNAKALQESEARYRLLADNVTDNLWTFDLGTMCFSYVSPSVIGITGYTAEEATGFQLQDTLTPSPKLRSIKIAHIRIGAILQGR